MRDDLPAPSYRQVPTRLSGVERFSRSFMHDFAAIHDVDVIGKLAAEVEILLDEQDGHAGGVAQMADRCYLEKCRDRLYPEFVAGGITRKQTDHGEVVVFSSAEDLVKKTPSFYVNASRRLDADLGGCYQYAKAHFGGHNLYMDAVQQNVRFAERIGSGQDVQLKRQPPSTN